MTTADDGHLHPMHPARWVLHQLGQCGFTGQRVLVFTRASTLVLARDLGGQEVVVKAGFGSNHVIDELAEDVRPASYGFYWYRSLDPGERLLARQDFEYEVGTALACSDVPNVVPVLRTGNCDRFDWYTMPHFPDGSFQQLVTPTTDVELLRSRWVILGDVAGALDRLHERGVVHRDVYAENVLIEHGRGFVTDFGASRKMSTRRGPERRGPEVHWAPEYLSDYAGALPAADVYSLAVLAHRATYGDLPRMWPPASSPQVPEDLRKVIVAALSRDPELRPTMSVLREAFASASASPAQ